MSTDRSTAGARQALYASLGLIALLGAVKMLGFTPLLQKLGYTLAVAYQLYLPLWLIDRGRERTHAYGIHMHGSLAAPLALLRRRCLRAGRPRPVGAWTRRLLLRLSVFLSPYAHHARFDAVGFKRDLVQVLALCGLTFPGFVVGHHLWQLWLAHRLGREAVYAFRLPPGFLEMAAVNLLLVALPEELFYRGFVHTRLVRAWKPWVVAYGVPVGRAIFVCSALFAVGHFAGEWNPARLGPFFPALLFSAMRARSGAIFGAVLYHGLANIFSESLRAGYTLM